LAGSFPKIKSIDWGQGGVAAKGIDKRVGTVERKLKRLT